MITTLADPAAILTACRAQGVDLLPDAASGLTVRSRRGAPSAELLALLRAHKPDLLRLLTAPPSRQPVPCSGDHHGLPRMRPTFGGDRLFCSRCDQPLFTAGPPPWIACSADALSAPAP